MAHPGPGVLNIAKRDGSFVKYIVTRAPCADVKLLGPPYLHYTFSESEVDVPTELACMIRQLSGSIHGPQPTYHVTRITLGNME